MPFNERRNAGYQRGGGREPSVGLAPEVPIQNTEARHRAARLLFTQRRYCFWVARGAQGAVGETNKLYLDSFPGSSQNAPAGAEGFIIWMWGKEEPRAGRQPSALIGNKILLRDHGRHVGKRAARIVFPLGGHVRPSDADRRSVEINVAPGEPPSALNLMQWRAVGPCASRNLDAQVDHFCVISYRR